MQTSVTVRAFTLTAAVAGLAGAAAAAQPAATPVPATAPSLRFDAAQVFDLQWASDPQISPDGRRVVYQRHFMDIVQDRMRSTLWIVGVDGTDHRPLTSGNRSDHSPRWSPDGRRLAYVSADDNRHAQIFVRWMDTGQTAQVTSLLQAPRGITWSPDGRLLAFTLFVPDKPVPFASMPDKPEGARWADPPRVIQKLVYRADGEGYLQPGHTHLFVVSADGGAPRQLTQGAFDHGGHPAWMPEGKSLLVTANRREDAEYEPFDTEIYEVALADGAIRALTDRRGPDHSPAVSPDGTLIAYTGFDDRYQGYQLTRLYVMNRDGSGSRLLTGGYDRDIEAPAWSRDGRGIYFATADRGNGKVAHVTLDGRVDVVAGDLGGGDLGRPYEGGTFTVAPDGHIAYTWSRPDVPADIAVVTRGAATPARVTSLNDGLFGHRTLARVEEVAVPSSHDGRPIQAWIAKPPGFEPGRKYPMILEIHGGPFANYGDRFGAEIQLYASAGYVVVYANPRGSTSYGEEFGNLIHHAYPGHDYDDLMSVVDAVVGRGYVDPDNLFVTGGSGGGVLTAWIVGKTHRFRAAVSAKPVINWHSFVLTADAAPFFYKYWFPAPPWERPDEYLRRSPLSLVGNVTTPTMLLTGELDYRTPISESEQFYQALKIRRVDTALVRVPDAPHEIIVRPSLLIAKVNYILAWFEKYRVHPGRVASGGGQGASAVPPASPRRMTRAWSSRNAIVVTTPASITNSSTPGPLAAGFESSRATTSGATNWFTNRTAKTTRLAQPPARKRQRNSRGFETIAAVA
jgi:acylaminoacyl-peptidase